MYVNIEWFKDARKRPVSINSFYSCTTYINGVDVMLSVTISIGNNINKGYLTFLVPDLVKDIKLKGMSINFIEGNNSVAVAKFI